MCLFVCLFARIFLKRPNFTKFSVHVTMADRSSSDGNEICYVLPVLWMTSSFHIIERMGRSRDDEYVSSSPRDGTGGEVYRL